MLVSAGTSVPIAIACRVAARHCPVPLFHERFEAMLTKADDYPIHQTAEPIAYAGTDRNFYDRYFFNGYTPDGSVFFAAALGVYPALNVMDGAFCVVVDGVQHNLRLSRVLGMEPFFLTPPTGVGGAVRDRREKSRSPRHAAPARQTRAHGASTPGSCAD